MAARDLDGPAGLRAHALTPDSGAARCVVGDCRTTATTFPLMCRINLRLVVSQTSQAHLIQLWPYTISGRTGPGLFFTGASLWDLLRCVQSLLARSVSAALSELRLVSNEQRTHPGRSFFGRA